MIATSLVGGGSVQANTAEPALPGRWCCPLEAEADEGSFGGGE